MTDPDPTVYATLDALKHRVNRTDSSRDDELTGKLATGARNIDTDTGRRFWLDDTATAKTFNPRGRIVRTRDGEKLLVPDIGDDTDMVVEVGQGDTWTAVTDYETGRENALAEGWAIEWLLRPCGWWLWGPRQRVRITTRWGWPSVPKPIGEANLLRAHRLYGRRDSPEGVTGTADQGFVRVGRYDSDYDKLIGPYVLPGFG